MGKVIPLNIVTSYPVRWKKYQVIRDFVQNFYDSVGYNRWNKEFQYNYSDNTLSMWVDGITFNYEWLLHIGGRLKLQIRKIMQDILEKDSKLLQRTEGRKHENG